MTSINNVLDPLPNLLQSDESLPQSLQSIKFMDDATVQERILLKTTLATNRDRSGPLPSWELGPQQEHGMLLPASNTLLQNQIRTIKSLSDNREMSLNCDKTCLFIVNFTQKYQFRPLLTIPGSSSPITRVLQTKLLGYWFTHDMKTKKHVDYMLSICYKRLWAIRKLKQAGVSHSDILHFYYMKIRSVLESNCVVYHPLLTQDENNDIERIKKIVLKIILDKKYLDYHQACLLLDVQSLPVRRIKLSLNFGLKCLSNNKFKHLFQPNTNSTVRNPEKFVVPFAKSTRYYNSPKLYITRLLNHHFSQDKVT